jgi:hypothetical protein
MAHGAGFARPPVGGCPTAGSDRTASSRTGSVIGFPVGSCGISQASTLGASSAWGAAWVAACGHAVHIDGLLTRTPIEVGR